MDTARSPSPSSLFGKRRIYDDSFCEPPRKSPVGTPICGSPTCEQNDKNVFRRRHSMHDEIELSSEMTRQSPQPSPTNRRVKKAVYRQRSLSPIINPLWVAEGSAGSSPRNSDPSGSPHVSDSELQDTFDMTITGTSSNDKLPMSFTVHRGNSSPLRNRLDDQRHKHKLRRRSSCKELTLRIMRRESVAVDQNQPLFRTIESLRRMSMQQSMAEDSAPCSPMDSPMVARRRLPVASPTPMIRSLSAEGYDAANQKEQQRDAHTMMFDSVPDLTADDSHERIASLKKNRRGAVCYDLDHAAVLLQNLNLELDEEEEEDDTEMKT